ncbi:MAG: hypothetical protein LBC96_09920 [Lachnospiraceae bacterium]|jgi:hypothetical protein|nr:hypothetical protein [Lachnospiraceae bacterium]
MGNNIDMRALTGWNTRRDYSMLINNLPSRAGMGRGQSLGMTNNNFLADYASIKNGSYAKLMNAYHSPNRDRVSGIANSSLSTSQDSTIRLKQIENAAEALKSSADNLLGGGAGSVFAERDISVTDENGVSTTKRDFDRDAIFKAISEFVTDYNNLIESAGGARAAAITGKITTMQNMTNANQNTLNRIGITVGFDGQLSINEEKLKGAEMATVQSLFNGTGSFAFRVSSQASWIGFAAANEATRSNTYNAQGGFTNNHTTGNIFGSFF